MRGYLDRGYTTVKMKIGGASLAEDLKRIEAVLAVVGDRRKNSRSTRTDGSTSKWRIAYAKALRNYGLFWYEEAGDPLDFALQADARAGYRRRHGDRGESVLHQDARNLLRYGGMRSGP